MNTNVNPRNMNRITAQPRNVFSNSSNGYNKPKINRYNTLSNTTVPNTGTRPAVPNTTVPNTGPRPAVPNTTVPSTTVPNTGPRPAVPNVVNSNKVSIKNSTPSIFTKYYDMIENSATLKYILIIVFFIVLLIIFSVFYRSYNETKSYVGEITGKQLANNDAALCKPYIRCMKEEGKKWFDRMDNYNLCEKCIADSKCPDYDTGKCKPGNCKTDDKGPDGESFNSYCVQMKPHSKPCSGFLQKSAPHCEIANVYSLKKAQDSTDSVSSYLPFDLSKLIPENPFQRLQSFVFSKN